MNDYDNLSMGLEEDQEEYRESFGIRENRHKQEGYYVFFSYDLVNSTTYKLKNKKDWPRLFDAFYSQIVTLMDNEFSGNAHVWKYVGDEVLFFMKIFDKKQLLDLCSKANKVQRLMTNYLHQNDLELARGLLYIKTTIWSADVKIISPGTNNEETQNGDINQNILIIKTDLKGTTFDFLGPEIDIGFRIAKFSEKNKLVVGAELAHLLYENRGAYETKHEDKIPRVEESLKIVSYETLKGVWNGRKYPIIWYHEEWSKKEKIFEYDEKYNSLLVEKIVSSDFKLGNISGLKKIYKDLNMLTHFKEILKNFENGSYSRKFQERELAKSVAEIHCVCICVSSENKILVAKRSNRINDDNKWEFGCGQIALGDDFEGFIKVTYMTEFGLDIEPLKSSGELVPIATYTLKRRTEKTKPGIIFVGKIKEENTLKFNSEKYSEAKLVTLSELDSFEDSKMVALMKENAHLALQFITSDTNE